MTEPRWNEKRGHNGEPTSGLEERREALETRVIAKVDDELGESGSKVRSGPGSDSSH